MPIPELMAGWRRFRAGRFRDQRPLFERLANSGQQPRIAMVACCDSRVDPAIVFDCDPGELFVVRNVANLVPPREEGGSYHGTSAALEYAIGVLGVRHVVVLGHSQCGGIQALLNGPPPGQTLRFVTAWMGIAGQAREAAMLADGLAEPERARLCERLAIRLSLQNLATFTGIRDRVARGVLQLHGWHFDLLDGVLTGLDAATDRFLPLAAIEGPNAP
jgi:carbonic anhydrase